MIFAPLCLGVSLISVSGLAGEAPAYATASLTDRNNLFIENLGLDEIQIFENDKLRKIELLAKDELPTVYGILFDRSMLTDSWESDRTRAMTFSTAVSGRDIAYELIDKYLGRHVVWVGVYGKELEVALDFSIDGFRAKEAIQQLRGTRRPQDSFLYGALFAAVQKMNERTEKRRVLLVFLDTVDPETAQKGKALRNLFSSSNVELFIVSFASKLGGKQWGMHPQMNQAFLKDLAQVTAGDAYFAADYRDHLEDISRRIYNQIRTLYTFGFQSELRSGIPARLTIKCSRPGSKIKHHPMVMALP